MEITKTFVGIALLLACFSSARKLPSKYDNVGDKDSPFFSSENLDISTSKTKNIARFLSRFGYTRGYTERKADLKESLKDFQFFGGLVVTGELDSETEALMKKDRCAVRDPSNIRALRLKREGKIRAGRSKRWNHQGTKWTKKVLTWRYQHNPNSNNARNGITEDAVRDVMKKAMALWEGKTNIQFVEDRDATSPDVWVLFASRRHNDPFPFDGTGGTLAHAFYPLSQVGLAGDVHFDDDETFTIGYDSKSQGRDLMWVAVHELGHTLGLEHSAEQGAIMYPYYTGYKENVQLTYDDTVGIQGLYGGKVPKPKKNIPKNKRCPRTALTAFWDYSEDFYITVSEDEKLYVISKRGNRGMVYANIPAKNYFRIPGKVTAIFSMRIQPRPELSEGEYNIVMTDKGDYYICKLFQIMSGPHSLHDRYSPLKIDFPHNIKKIDAAMKWWVNGKIYFFAGNNYWRYDESRKQFDEEYPKSIHDNWFGVPSNLDAAYSSRDGEGEETLFIKGDKIYKVQERPRPMELAAGYPKSVRDDFLKCIAE